VLYFLAYAVVRLLLEVLIVRGGPNAKLRVEVLALRHQLRVLERQVGRPRWQPTHLYGQPLLRQFGCKCPFTLG
jgi:hypothetical protein